MQTEKPLSRRRMMQGGLGAIALAASAPLMAAGLTADEQGRFRVKTIKPGHYPVREGWSRPPHIHFKVAQRGYREITTQMYFSGEALNDVDLLWSELSPDDRARVTVAFSAEAGMAPAGQFDLVIQKV